MINKFNNYYMLKIIFQLKILIQKNLDNYNKVE